MAERTPLISSVEMTPKAQHGSALRTSELRPSDARTSDPVPATGPATENAQILRLFFAVLTLSLLLGLGLIMGGLRLLGHQWRFKKSDGEMHGREVVGVALVLIGIAASLMLGGQAISHLGVLRHAYLGRPVRRLVTAGAWLVAALLTVLLALGIIPVLETKRFWQQDYDEL